MVEAMAKRSLVAYLNLDGSLDVSNSLISIVTSDHGPTSSGWLLNLIRSSLGDGPDAAR